MMLLDTFFFFQHVISVQISLNFEEPNIGNFSFSTSYAYDFKVSF